VDVWRNSFINISNYFNLTVDKGILGGGKEMFRKFFKIGIGGCGCQLERTFEEEVRRRLRKLSPDGFMESNEGLGSLLPYEKKVIENAIDVNRVLLEGLRLDSAAAEEGEKDRKLYNYSHDVKETRDLIVDRYGRELIDSDGFNHHPELQMFPLSIKEVRNEVFRNIEAEVRKWRKAADRGYFFLVGLGGGTGTGLISPLAQKIGEGLRGYFALGALSGGEDKKYLNPQQPWFRRCFNILIALNDLIATARLGGLILVDNEKIIERLKGNLEELGHEKEGSEKLKKNEERIDEEIIRAIFPAFGETACEDPRKADWSRLSVPVSGGNKSPIFVPCYASGDTDTATLIEEAISKGMLANLNLEKGDHKKADKIFVFTRKIGNEIEVKKKLWSIFDKGVSSYDKGMKIGIIEKNENDPVMILNDNKIIVLESAEIGMDRKKNEVLVLLRNPGIEDMLSGRLEVAKSFVEVLNMLVELINRRDPTPVPSEVAVEDMMTWLDNNEEIVADLIKALALHQPVKEIILEGRKWVIIDEEKSYFIKKNNNNLEIYSIRTDDIKRIVSESILTKDKEERGEKELLKEILREAIVFLFPKEVVEENEEEYYVRASKILEKLNIEANHALTALGSDNWPIFKEPIFDIEPGYVSRDVVMLTSILSSGYDAYKDFKDAMGDLNFNKLFRSTIEEMVNRLASDNLDYVINSGGSSYNLTTSGESALPTDLQDLINIAKKKVK
jgi:hypothetical protein